ncbi:MAG: tRNA 2-thiouridine(34) synthase MnmA [Candidatus Omnitrophica bacterium]|nr:tRNA 2-thiouridine(34) synthase MnmA [Candidatus Omnitrophota bacterium]
MANKRVAVAMSGGVDSSTAAAILIEKGFDVTGITMSFGLCGSQAVSSARRVSDYLGIRHRVVDFNKILEEKVINNFLKEYLAGRTPNPCVRCNQYIKFGVLLKQVLAWNYDFLATGHYVGRIKTKEGFLIRKGRDKNKDQSYFLYRLSQSQLKNTLFPLENFTKQAVIEIAKEMKLPVEYGNESQEICFLAGRDYRVFLKKRLAGRIKPGLILSTSGKILGQHKGVAFYTVGQRDGLNVALGERAYISKIDAVRNQITLASRNDACGREFKVIRANFLIRAPKKKVVYRTKIRYNHKEAQAEVVPEKGCLRVKFKRPQFAITPGQSAVFYKRNMVIGGGIISYI